MTSKGEKRSRKVCMHSFSAWYRMLIAVASCLIMSFVVSAESRYWVNYKGGATTPNWKSYGDANNWGVWAGSETPPPAMVPTSSDWINYGEAYSWNASWWMDLGGDSYTIKGLECKITDASTRRIQLRNGTLTMTETMSNNQGRVSVYTGGKLVLPSTSYSRLGHNGGTSYLTAKDGGEVEVYGGLDIHRLLATVENGGKMIFAPASLTMPNLGNMSGSPVLSNSGSLALPNGLLFSSSYNKTTYPFRILQVAGTLTLGGSIVRASAFKLPVNLTISNGTVRATADVAFSGLNVVEMSDDAVVTFDVEVGKTLYVTNMTFGANTHVTKTGFGTVCFGSSLPSAFLLSEGSAEYAASAALGDSVTMRAGTSMILAASGVTATDIGGIAEAAVTLASGFDVGHAFGSTNETLLAVVASKLQSAVVSGKRLTQSGTALVLERTHTSRTFAWNKMIVDLWRNDFDSVRGKVHERFHAPANWCTEWVSDGTAQKTTYGANPDVLFPGAGDSFYINDAYSPLFAVDMEGAECLFENYDKTGYKETYGWYGFSIKNGTFGFTKSFLSMRACIFVHAGGKFVLGDESASCFDYAGSYVNVYEGGEVVLGGSVTNLGLSASIQEGGKMTLKPKNGILMMPFSDVIIQPSIENNGTLSLPNGLTFSGYGRDIRTFTIAQKSGVLELGGVIAHSKDSSAIIPYGTFAFSLEGGKVVVTDNAAFLRLTTCTMPDEATVEIEVAKGKVLDLTEMIFGTNTKIVKTGLGRIRFGNSRPTVYENTTATGLVLLVR